MFKFLSKFKRGQTVAKKEVAAPRLLYSQEQVLKALQEVKHPINGLAVARHMHADSASVTPRLAELRKKGLIKVSYVKHGLDNKRRNFYVINER
jgi:DNA-binding MarR family transcriptional regulator